MAVKFRMQTQIKVNNERDLRSTKVSSPRQSGLFYDGAAAADDDDHDDDAVVVCSPSRSTVEV